MESEDSQENPDGNLIQPSSEYIQKKLYFLTEHLKSYHEKLPMNIQMKLPYEFLVDLANSLLNDTVFEIIRGLLDLQQVTEKYLFQQRENAIKDYELEIQEWTAKISDPEELHHIVELMKIKHNKKLKEIDKESVLALDLKVKDQQEVLQKAGIPGFFPTDNSNEIIIQMHLLDFILRLSKLAF